VPAAVDVYSTPLEPLHPWWVSGYLTVYGSFSADRYVVAVTDNFTLKPEGDEVPSWVHRFCVSFSLASDRLAHAIALCLGLSCTPVTRVADKRIDLIVSSDQDCLTLFSFLSLYPLQSSKQAILTAWGLFVEATYLLHLEHLAQPFESRYKLEEWAVLQALLNEVHHLLYSRESDKGSGYLSPEDVKDQMPVDTTGYRTAYKGHAAPLLDTGKWFAFRDQPSPTKLKVMRGPFPLGKPTGPGSKDDDDDTH
jgi:hypothetical protein